MEAQGRLWAEHPGLGARIPPSQHGARVGKAEEEHGDQEAGRPRGHAAPCPAALGKPVGLEMCPLAFVARSSFLPREGAWG